MNRRAFLASVTAGLATGLAGCRRSASGGSTPRAEGEGETATATPGPGERATPTPTATGTPRDVPSLAELGSPASICETSITPGFSIKEIVDPAFDTGWEGYEIRSRYLREESDERLADVATVVGREADGGARAYPVSVLWQHEIVNDTHGLPLIVTFCSICRSGLVARRVVDGTVTRFGVSGQLWRPPDRYIPASEQSGRTFGADRWEGETSTRNGANLVMYDELTGSFWSQGIGRAICGPAAGTDLEIVP
ncbi:MAG: DUF3179 domain-containing (seleno)protein, partial [Haloarculaceae archaeon]